MVDAERLRGRSKSHTPQLPNPPSTPPPAVICAHAGARHWSKPLHTVLYINSANLLTVFEGVGSIIIRILWLSKLRYRGVTRLEAHSQQARVLQALPGRWEPSSHPLRGAVTWIKCVHAGRASRGSEQSKPEMFASIIYFFILSYFSERMFNV